MILRNFLVYIVVMTASFDFSHAFSLLNWLYWVDDANSNTGSISNQKLQEPSNVRDVREDIKLIPIKFEELSPEDKFLQEAEQFSSISHSELDTCEHRVVLKLQSSCTDVNEEQLAKLSINLLNCQAQVSGKPQIMCTSEMSLKDCTADMDSEMWNAYHIINNRARAVCYALRQQQFRALSEMTVNKLMTSALKQLSTMNNLEELQKELNLLTADTLNSLKEKQAGLAEGNKGIQLAELKVRDSIIGNLRQLTQEKTLIQNTQNQLKTLSDKLTQEIENVGVQMESHSEHHHAVHNTILSKLSDISQKTDSTWSAIDKKNCEIRAQQDDIKKELLKTMDNLKEINTSVIYLLNIVTQVKNEVDENIAWASNSMGADSLTLVLLLQHILFLLVGILLSLFLQLSLLYRLCLLLTTMTNIVLVYHQQSYGFRTLTATILGGWALILLIHFCSPCLKEFIRKSNSKTTPKTAIDNNCNEEDDLSMKGSSKAESIALKYSLEDNQLSYERKDDDRSSRDTNSVSSLRFRSSISRMESACAALCRNGQLCRSSALPGRRYCRRHVNH